MVRSSASIRRAASTIASTGLRARRARNHPPSAEPAKATGARMRRTRRNLERVASTFSNDMATWTILTVALFLTTGKVRSRNGFSDFGRRPTVSNVASPLSAFRNASALRGSFDLSGGTSRGSGWPYAIKQLEKPLRQLRVQASIPDCLQYRDGKKDGRRTESAMARATEFSESSTLFRRPWSSIITDVAPSSGKHRASEFPCTKESDDPGGWSERQIMMPTALPSARSRRRARVWISLGSKPSSIFFRR